MRRKQTARCLILQTCSPAAPWSTRRCEPPRSLSLASAACATQRTRNRTARMATTVKTTGTRRIRAEANSPVSPQQRLRVWTRRLTIVNTVMVLAVLFLLCVVSEEWWISAALGYLPRAPYLIPSLFLIPLCLVCQRSFTWANVLCTIVVLGPVMGLCAPLERDPPPDNDSRVLTVVSCNAQNGASDLHRALREIEALHPDVVALQETKWGIDMLDEFFVDWESIHVGEYWVGSRFPLRLVGELNPEAFERSSGLMVEVEAPQGTFLLANVHLNTARHGLSELQWHSPLTGAGVDDFEWHQWRRQLEAEETVALLASRATRPQLLLGDFNAPTTSSLFAGVWNGYRSAFDTTAFGYGYTAPCNTSRFWPSNTPWLRIDHILCDSTWNVHACGIGESDGSDHRLIWAQVSLKAEPADRTAQ
ncbi:MAG: hypothetical protein DWQ29_23960 [Planctomycetota bacterium]|nr:MAG: hypothetical protein DWQ29_23960 [Planctomycetota bacterium]